MAYGFDPNIILSGRQYTGPDAGDVVRTLADLSLRRAQQQQAEDAHRAQQQQAAATLADMARKQSRQQALSDIFRQNADNPAAVGPALMRGGHGPEALDWMGAQAGMEAKQAQAKKAQQEEMKGRLDLLSRPLRGGVPKSQADLDRLWKAWEASGLSTVELTGVPKQYSPELAPLFEQIRGLGVSSEDAAKLEQRDEELGARTADREAQRKMLTDRAQASATTKAAATSAKAQARQARAAEKAAKAEGKAQAASKAQYLEGYELLPEASPSKSEVEKARAAQGVTRTIVQTVGDIQKIYKKYGNTPLPGPVKAQMQALATDLKMTAKSESQYQLGVIAGPDMGLLESVVPDPSTANTTALDFVGGSQSMDRLGVFRGQALRRFENRARSLGYKPKGGGASAPAGSPFQTPPGAKAQATGGAGTPVSAADLLLQMRGR